MRTLAELDFVTHSASAVGPKQPTLSKSLNSQGNDMYLCSPRGFHYAMLLAHSYMNITTGELFHCMSCCKLSGLIQCLLPIVSALPQTTDSVDDTELPRKYCFVLVYVSQSGRKGQYLLEI